jgi:hypothetical protein
MTTKRELRAYEALENGAEDMLHGFRDAVTIWDALGNPEHWFWRNVSPDQLVDEFEFALLDLGAAQFEYMRGMRTCVKAMAVLNTVFSDD